MNLLGTLISFWTNWRRGWAAARRTWRITRASRRCAQKYLNARRLLSDRDLEITDLNRDIEQLKGQLSAVQMELDATVGLYKRLTELTKADIATEVRRRVQAEEFLEDLRHVETE